MTKNNISLSVIFTALLIGIHFSINTIIDYSINMKLFFSIHLMLGIILLLIVLMLNAVQKQLPDKLGMAFLAAVTFKMLFSALYIYLMIKGLSNMKIAVVHFFIVYLFYLIAEVVFALQVLKKSDI